MNGMVLDLRNDPGGLLNGAVAVSAAFLPKDALVVYTDGRTEDAKMRLTASPEHYLRGRNSEDYLKQLPADVKNVPMVVLVNGGSASASEIVAGALQDHKRAVIMGTQTFGKGSVQTILPLGNNTAIKLTTARYYTPQRPLDPGQGHHAGYPLETARRTSSQPEAARSRSDQASERSAASDRKTHGQGGSRSRSRAEIQFHAGTAAARSRSTRKSCAAEPGEVVSTNDYELNQAVAFLKSRRASPTPTE